jgi:hypothetical protein
MSYLGLPFGHHCQIDFPYLHSKTEVVKAEALSVQDRVQLIKQEFEKISFRTKIYPCVADSECTFNKHKKSNITSPRASGGLCCSGV